MTATLYLSPTTDAVPPQHPGDDRVAAPAQPGQAIDLDQEAGGGWRLVDWKTGWLMPDQVAERAGEYCLQLAAYAHAAQRVLGVRPRASLCFLAARAVVYEFRPEELNAAWQDVLGA